MKWYEKLMYKYEILLLRYPAIIAIIEATTITVLVAALVWTLL